MANDSKRVSQLGITTTLSANTDRVVVLTNPSTSPATQTINVNNFVTAVANLLPLANGSSAGVIKVGNNLSINASGYLSGADNNTGDIYFTNNVISSNNSNLILQAEPNQLVNIIANTNVQIQYNPNNQVSDGFTDSTSWAYVGPNIFGAEVYSGNSTYIAGLYLNGNTQGNNITLAVIDKSWVYQANGTITFPDNSIQSTAYTTPPGPYANDDAANTGGVPLNGLYYDSTGTVKIRLL